MKKMILLIVCSIFLVTSADAEVKQGAAKEAEQLVKKAIAYIKANGKEKAFTVFTDKKGPFVNKDLYISVWDFNGNCLAQGSNSAMVGKNLIGLRDGDGKFLIKERINMAKNKSAFWMDYKFSNPVTKKVEPKSAYSEVLGDIIVTCGIYKR